MKSVSFISYRFAYPFLLLFLKKYFSTMIRYQKQIAFPTAACAIILLVTLFFGLKPKGFRFINQVKWLENRNGIAFTNIGMVYGEKTLGEIGVDDSISIVMVIRPYRTARKSSRIAAIIEKNGDELFTIDQWMMGIEVSRRDRNGTRISAVGFDDVFAFDSSRLVMIAITPNEISIRPENPLGSIERRTIRLPPGHLKNCRMLLGLSAFGRKPWRGEIAGLALFGRVLNEAIIYEFFKEWRENDSCGFIFLKNPAALFCFNERCGRTVSDQSGNGWDLDIPFFPKIFKHKFIQVLPDFSELDKSLAKDTIMNFFGFFPFGGCFFLLMFPLLQSEKKALLFTIFSTVCLSLFIEIFQIFIPTRTSQLIDILLNAAGSSTGAHLAYRVLARCKASFGSD
ncbi:MAG: VanZ family protein [Chitinispirillaceae bacterium]|nr:VanZ family protein [Chitinispirillaceae bacterium]